MYFYYVTRRKQGSVTKILVIPHLKWRLCSRLNIERPYNLLFLFLTAENLILLLWMGCKVTYILTEFLLIFNTSYEYSNTLIPWFNRPRFNISQQHFCIYSSRLKSGTIELVDLYRTAVRKCHVKKWQYTVLLQQSCKCTVLCMSHVNVSNRNKQQVLLMIVHPRNSQVSHWLQFPLVLSHPLEAFFFSCPHFVCLWRLTTTKKG